MTTPTAFAAQHAPRSAFTSIDLDRCDVTQKHPDGNTWRCEGLPRFPVYVAEGDHRYFISMGPNPQQRQAATQTLGPFNTPVEPRSKRIIIEWRFVIREGRRTPYAAIVRYFTASDTGRGQILVVSRVTAEDTCHVAHIDALANPDAMVIARAVADGQAREEACPSTPRWIGPDEPR